MISLRTPETEERYQRERKHTKGCFICKRDLFVREFKHWVIVENRWMYDAIAKVNHVLAPKRHIQKMSQLNREEQKEYFELMDTLKDYHFVMFNFPERQSHKSHLHFHLNTFKDE